MRAVRQSNRRRCAADLLHRNHVRKIAHRGSAVFLFDGDAEKPDITHAPPELGWEPVLPVDVRRPGRNVVGRELLHGGAQHVDRLAKMKVERRKIEHGRCRQRSGVPAMTISVCCMMAHSVRLPARSA